MWIQGGMKNCGHYCTQSAQWSYHWHKENLPEREPESIVWPGSHGSPVFHTFSAYTLLFLVTVLATWQPHNLTASQEIAHAQMCTSCVLNNTKNIVSKTTLMKCQLSLGSKPT